MNKWTGAHKKHHPQVLNIRSDLDLKLNHSHLFLGSVNDSLVVGLALDMDKLTHLRGRHLDGD